MTLPTPPDEDRHEPPVCHYYYIPDQSLDNFHSGVKSFRPQDTRTLFAWQQENGDVVHTTIIVKKQQKSKERHITCCG